MQTESQMINTAVQFGGQTIPANLALMMQAMRQPYMYTTPYQPGLVQNAAVFGASMMGYSNPVALPVVPGGRSVYDSTYAAQFTTPLYSTMQNNFNQGTGRMLGAGLAAAGRNMGMDGEWQEALVNAGGSPIGSMLAGALQETPAMQMITGGNPRDISDIIFDNRRRLAFQTGSLIDPASKIHAGAASTYANRYYDEISKQLYADEDGVPDVTITGGRDVGNVGKVFSMMLATGKLERGMGNEAWDILSGAQKSGKDLNEDELRRLTPEIKQSVDKVIGMSRAMADIMDALGTNDLMGAVDKLQRATQGAAFSPNGLSIESLKDLGRNLSAGSKFGLSADSQLGIMAQVGGMAATTFGGVNTTTGRADDSMSNYMGKIGSNIVLTMMNNTDMDEGAARAISGRYMGAAMTSTAGRAGFLIESAYRTGQLNTDLYNRYIEAGTAGNLKHSQGLFRDISSAMYGDERSLFSNINDPAEMRMANLRLQKMSPEVQKAAELAMGKRITVNSRRELLGDVATRLSDTAVNLAQGVRRDTGQDINTVYTSDDQEEYRMRGYLAYLNKAKPAKFESMKAVLQARFEEDGIEGVNELLGSAAFSDVAPDMLDSGDVSVNAGMIEAVVKARNESGAAGKWLDNFDENTGEDFTDRIDAARKAIVATPKSTRAVLDKLYGSLGKDAQNLIDTPAEMLNKPDARIQRAKKLMDISVVVESTINNAAGRKEVQSLVDGGMPYAEALREVSGLSAEQWGTLEGTSSLVGMISEYGENYNKLPTVAHVNKMARAVDEQGLSEAEINEKNKMLRLNLGQAAVKFITQEEDAGISLWDVFKIRPGAREGATEEHKDALDKLETIDSVADLKKLSDKDTAQLKKYLPEEQQTLLDEMRSFASESTPPKRGAVAQQRSLLKRLSTNIGDKLDFHANPFFMGAEVGMSVLGGSFDTLMGADAGAGEGAEYAKGGAGEGPEYAKDRSGKKGEGDVQRIIIEAGNLTIDVDGLKHTGTLSGEGRSI